MKSRHTPARSTNVRSAVVSALLTPANNHGLQCGFCTPGMTMSAVDFAKQTPNPTEDDVRHWLEGNICRCTGYQNIVAAVLAGAAAMQTQAGG